MTLTIPDEVRAKAEIYLGDAAGQEKTRLLLQETGLPSGLLPLKDIIECGYVEETRFVWLKQRKKVDHYFAKAGRHVTYAAEVSAYADQGRLHKITGVKAKEMMIWVTLNEICVDDPPKGKLHCKAIGGLSRSFPVEAFEAEDKGRVFDRYGGIGPAQVPPNGNGNGNGVAVAVAGAGVVEKKEEGGVVAVKKEEGEEKAAAAKEGEEGSKKDDGVDKVEEKLKEMSTGEQVVHANGEAVAAKN